jgi:hypothetical protein
VAALEGHAFGFIGNDFGHVMGNGHTAGFLDGYGFKGRALWRWLFCHG